MSSPAAPHAKTPTRAIAALGLAAFATQAMVRATDSLLPQIAADLDTTVGAASVVVTAYAAAHGLVQLIVGPLGDRMSRYRTIALACALSSLMVLSCGLARSMPTLIGARIASGMVAAWIIPLAVTFIGDVVPYDKRQRALGAFLFGQILGQIFGQSASGIIGDHFGWRMVFFVLAALFAAATAALVGEIAINPLTRIAGRADLSWRNVLTDYGAVVSSPWARTVLTVVFLAGALMFGPFAFVGADLRLRFGLNFTLIGAVIATFALGGLLYSIMVKQLVERLGEAGLTFGGGLLLAAGYLVLCLQTSWLGAPAAIAALGLGFYMMQATLQTHATQMVPHVRGTAVSMFGSAFYLGQTAGVALAAPIVDHQGAPTVFAVAAVLFPLLSGWFVWRQSRR